jgi:hypothetical protein
MSAQDAMFLHVENDVTPMHIGGVSIFEGPPPAFGDLMAMVAATLDHTPRYRQKVKSVPFGVSEPVWVDDRYFELSYHLRHTAVPAPGSEAQLRAMAARVFSQHLDRARPLWEIWMVEGLSEGRWALLSKVHHRMVDGVAATDLMSVMFDDAAGAAGTGSPDAEHWSPRPEPSGVELLVRGVAMRAIDPGSQLRGALTAWPQLVSSAASTARALAAATPALRPATTSLTGPIGPHPQLELGQGLARRRQARARGARWHGQRHRAHGHHQRSPRCSRGCRSASRTPRRAWPTSGRRWTGSRPAILLRRPALLRGHRRPRSRPGHRRAHRRDRERRRGTQRARGAAAAAAADPRPVAHRPLREHGHRVTSPELRQARLVRRSRCARWGDGSG